MAMQNYATQASRNIIYAEGKMLKRAENIQVLTMFGDQKKHPKNKTDTVVFRRLKPFNATSSEVANITVNDFIATEGMTPTPNQIGWTDVSTTLQQYTVLFSLSSKSELTYEDNIPEAMIDLTGDTLGEVAELVCYGQVKSGTSIIYANGTTRAGLNSALSLGKLRQAARSLESNRATNVTKTVKPGPNFGTSYVSPGYIVFIHTDLEADANDLPKFVSRYNYGSSVKPLHEREIGSCERFRFITSPLFTPYLAAGDTDDSTMVSAGGSNNDVYPVIVMAEDAWGVVSLKGHGKTSISPTYLPPTKKTHANPAGMFGYVGADFWMSAVRLNENWMTRIECCATEL